jgi:hypothetical protein
LVLLTKRLLPPCYLRAIIDWFKNSQKLMLKIRQEDYKTAIDLWKYFIGHAYYENDKKYLSPGYFNLGYSYYKEGYIFLQFQH